MPSDYACAYCKEDVGGFHGCRAEVRHVIERYFSDSEVLDVDELTNLIGALGYYGDIQLSTEVIHRGYNPYDTPKINAVA